MENVIVDFFYGDKIKSWSKMAKECPFVIFKGTQRCDFVDPKLKEHINGCENHKIPYWIYTYLEKGNEKKQAEFLIKTCKPLVGKFFVGYCLDAEVKNDANDIFKALQVVLKESKKAILYTMHSQYSYVKPVLAHEELRDMVAWWEARYGKDTGKYDPKYAPHQGVDLHQYSKNGTVGYVSNLCDVSRLTGTRPIEWFTTPYKKPTVVDYKYSGPIPYFPKRGYYRYGDGISTYVTYASQIKHVQKIVNYILKEIDGVPLAVDGKYGKKTRAAVEEIQILLKVKSDGLFGPVTLTAALKYVV